MKKKLEQMEVELREVMVYQSPPELGALWTEVLQQSKIINARQAIALKAQIEKNHREEVKHAKFMEKVHVWTWWIGGLIGILLLTFILMVFVAEDRMKKYPQLGYELFPKTEKQRKEEAQPKKYIGR
jgi:cytoskeletal protein RodZ